MPRGCDVCLLPTHQFSSSHSPATLRTKVVLLSRHFSSSSSTAILRVLKLYYAVASSQLPAPRVSCTTTSPVLIFQLPSYSTHYSYYTVASSQLLPTSHLPAAPTPRTKVVLRSRQFSASSSTDCSAYYSCTTKSPVLSFQLPSYSAYYSCTTKSPVLISQLPRYSTPSSCTTHSPVLIFPLPSYSAY